MINNRIHKYLLRPIISFEALGKKYVAGTKRWVQFTFTMSKGK